MGILVMNNEELTFGFLCNDFPPVHSPCKISELRFINGRVLKNISEAKNSMSGFIFGIVILRHCK